MKSNKNIKNKKKKKKNKPGFTLIELLAVIIILGIIMLIAIPSVTRQITESRRKTYLDTVKEYVKGASILVNSGEDISFYDTNTTVYIPTTCIPTESGGKSPFGEFDPGYVVVIYTGNGYKYYWTGRDTANIGIYLSDADKLDTKLIQTGVKEINNSIGVGDRENILVINDTCKTNGIEKTTASFTAEEDVIATSIDDIKPGAQATAQVNGTWFDNSSINKNQVISIDVVNHQNIPENAESWTCGSGVKCWKILDEDKYRVYIGAEKGVLAPENSNCLFEKFNNLTSLNVKYLNTSKVKYMSSMFGELTNLRTLDVSNFDTSNVEGFDRGWWSGVFYQCSKLESLDLRNWDTRKVTSMIMMFYGCSNLKSITFGSKWDTSNVKNMTAMFDGCSKLESLDLSNFNTSKVTSMEGMFFKCSSLKTLDLTSFNTSKVTEMAGMFQYCSSLTTLDLSSFDTSKVTVTGDSASNVVTSFGGMFSGDKKLQTIYASNKFVIDKITKGYHMFSSCESLVGGNGTRYSSSHTTQSYARIDTPDTPGYFTLK